MLSGKASLHLYEAPLIVLLVTGSQLKVSGRITLRATLKWFEQIHLCGEAKVVRSPRVRKCVGLGAFSQCPEYL